MAKIYSKILISELTDEIMEKSLVRNPYKARRTQDGLYVFLSFEESNIPLELFKLGYPILNSAQMRTEVQNSEWEKEETQPQHLRSSKQPSSELLEDSRSMASDFNSAPMDVSRNSSGFISATWNGIDGTNSTMVIEGSNDGVNWAELGGDLGGITIQSLQNDTQIWEFTSFTTKLVRLAYKANNVTTGNVTITGYKRNG